MSTFTVLLPGSVIAPDLLPKSKKGTLTLGPGLRHVPPSTISTTTFGTLQTDSKKSAVWLEHPTGGRYLPAVGDLVVAQVHHSGAELFACSLTAHTNFANLGHLAFEGASKKSRPNLRSGDLVYARVAKTGRWEETDIECVNSATGKSEGMGPLKGGMVFDVSPAFARRLMLGSKKGAMYVLEALGEKVRFEVAVGRNGKVWVDSGSVKETVMIGRCLREVDEQGLNEAAQKALVKRMIKTG